MTTDELRTRANAIAAEVEAALSNKGTVPLDQLGSCFGADDGDAATLRRKYFDAQQRLYFLRMLALNPTPDNIHRTLHATRTSHPLLH